MSEAVSATGTLVKRSPYPPASPPVYTTVAELTNVGLPGKSRNKIETSTHNDGAESYILGILRQKDPTVRINWLGDDATHAEIESDIDGNVKAMWQFALPSGITITGPGRVQRFEPVDAGVDAAQQLDFAIAWAGPLVFDYPP